MKSIAVAMMLTATSANGAETPRQYTGSYLCSVNATGGLSYDKEGKNWEAGEINLRDKNYLVVLKDTGKVGVSPLSRDEVPIFELTIKAFGKDEDPKECFDPDDADPQVGEGELKAYGKYFSCKTDDYREYTFNFETKRMVIVYKGGFIYAYDEDLTTPFIAGATCEKMQ